MLGIILGCLAFVGFLIAGLEKFFSGQNSQAAIFFFCSLLFLNLWAYIFWLRVIRHRGKRGD